MEPYQERVLEEAAQLAEKVQKLAKFIFLDKEIFPKLPLAEQYRLMKQHVFMSGYLEVIHERIKAF